VGSSLFDKMLILETEKGEREIDQKEGAKAGKERDETRGTAGAERVSFG